MVPVVDLKRRGARLADQFSVAADRVTRSGHFLLGPETEKFERAWADYVGASHVVAVSSGASALQLGLTALGSGYGTEVIVLAFTAVPTISAVVATGATPVIVDVDPMTACLDHAAATSAVTERTVAIVVVHLYGFPSTIPSIDVPVLEDAAQAHAALSDPGRSAVSAYSFYPTKNLGGIGDGGAVVTNDPGIADNVRCSRAHGMGAQYVHELISQNHRMSEIEAAWLFEALQILDEDVRARRAIAAAYRSAAPQLHWQMTDPAHAYHLCVFRHEDRDRCRELLSAAGVATAVHYPLALTQQPAYKTLAERECPTAESWAAECVTVPCFPEMTPFEVDEVCHALVDLESC